MLVWILLVAQVVIYLTSRFLIKNKIVKKILFLASIVLIAVWTVDYGIDTWLSFYVWPLLVAIFQGYGLYFLSLLVVGTRLTKENLFPFRCFKFKGKLKTALRKESLRNIFSSSYEELLYRWFLQNALYVITKHAVVSIAITVIVFTAIHYRKNIAIVQMTDIFLVSLVITVGFYFAANPIYSIIMHLIRNQLVICQKYVTVQNENERRAKYFKLLRERKMQEHEQ